MFIIEFSDTIWNVLEIILYFLMQLLIGRYQGKVLLMYDEILLIILSHIGFFIGSFLVQLVLGRLRNSSDSFY